MFRPESWSCRSTAEWECTWYHRWLSMNGCNRIRTIFVSLFTGKKTHTYFYSQRTISAAIPWDAWTAWPQNPPWGCLPCRSWSSQPCLHKKWVAEFRSGTQRHLSQKRRHLNCQTICFPTVCKAHMAIPYHSINRPVAIAVFACNRCLLRMRRSSWDHPEYVISFCWASNCPMPSQKTCKKKFSSTLYIYIWI